MNFRLLEYIVAIEKYGTMTGAARKFFITPSALNQQLLKLEDTLGTPLFTRARRRLIPTAAGEVYLRSARQILSIWQATSSELQDLTDCTTGTYRIGLTYDHGSEIFARIYPDFHREYPQITMRCYQLLSAELMKMLVDGDLDMAFLLCGKPESWQNIEYLPLSSENLLLGLPGNHPLAPTPNRGDIPVFAPDLAQLKDDSFALTLEKSTMRQQLINPIFESAGFTPNIMVESSFNSFLEKLTAGGLCNTIIPQSRIHNHKDIAWFYLPGSPRFHFGVGHVRGYRLNAALQYFIELAGVYAKKHLDFPAPDAPLLKNASRGTSRRPDGHKAGSSAAGHSSA
ncbi:MAG: LysR family transcriptional regulator [Fretibacterium sp.]|nr:LysR family transcriptional regulator [Fretibacterium sp.]